jgi:hypothetical protein
MQTEHDVINISPLGGAVYSFQQQKCPDSPLALIFVILLIISFFTYLKKFTCARPDNLHLLT